MTHPHVRLSRRWATLAVIVAGLLTAASPAQAQCPGADGTLPGSSDSVTTVATPAATLYVDDRDMLDLDDDQDAGGIWIYLESNDQEGLQRGGDHVAFETYDELGAPLPDIYVPPRNIQVGPINYTLFPCGGLHIELHACTNGGQPLRVTAGMQDDCIQSPDPDTLVF